MEEEVEEISPPVKEEAIEPPKIETPTTPAPPVETPEPEQEPAKAPEPEEKGGICGPTVVVLLVMVVLAFTRGMRELKRNKYSRKLFKVIY